MKRFLLPLLIIFALTSSAQQSPVIRFTTNPMADYLFYLFYRTSPKDISKEGLVNLNTVPMLDQLIALPEMAASANIEDYKEIYPIASVYKGQSSTLVTSPRPRMLGYGLQLPSYDLMMDILKQGEAHYPSFYSYWHEAIRPQELMTLNLWKVQDSLLRPFELLQQITRIDLMADTLEVACIAFHRSGSSNYSPPGVYTGIFAKPNLPWVLGHEGTHLLLTPWYGKDWKAHPDAARAMALAEKNGMRGEDLEELLCSYMMITLSQHCDLTDRDKRMSGYLPDGDPRKEVLMALENNWKDYLPDTNRNIIDYLMECTLKSLQ